MANNLPECVHKMKS